MSSPAASVNQGGESLGLLTDLYELTMAYAYWRSGRAEKQAAFHLSFRNAPFEGGFTVACGLSAALDFFRNFRFEDTDLEYLASVPGRDRQPLFTQGFLDYLKSLRFTADVDAVPEGTVVFPHEPLLRVQGPIIQGQLAETALLNFINFQSLIATKAARICLAARGEPVIEFGLRRAQGINGGLSASRAAYVGGCAGTSNVLAGKLYGIPVSGTHAHSWVLSFDTELEAFAAYAKALPNNCIFLVDTFDSLAGVRHAVAVGKALREQGHELAGIRLDSGDLAFLSKEARRILDDAGFPDAAIVASNELDEHLVESLKHQGARINVWGIGTRLVTAYDQPALGGVYKLSAMRSASGTWEPKLKLSEYAAKSSNPGILQVRRFRSETEFIGDAIYDESRPLPASFTIVDPADPTRRKHFDPGATGEDLLVPIWRNGTLVFKQPSLREVCQRVQEQLSCLHPGIKRLVNPHQYPAGLELSLHELKTKLIVKNRAQ